MVKHCAEGDLSDKCKHRKTGVKMIKMMTCSIEKEHFQIMDVAHGHSFNTAKPCFHVVIYIFPSLMNY